MRQAGLEIMSGEVTVEKIQPVLFCFVIFNSETDVGELEVEIFER